MSDGTALTWTLSGFGDEISPDLDTQIDVMTERGVRHLELRSVDGVNVLDLTDGQVADVARRLDERGMAVSAIGSPLGKTSLAEPFERTEPRLRRALDLATRFRAAYVRVFSFYPDGERSRAAFDEAAARLRRMAAAAGERGVVLAHENEKGIVGERAEARRELLEAVGSPALRAVFDPANFVQVGERPYPDAFERVRPWLAYVHVKDARFGTGDVAPAGEGDARFGELLGALAATGFSGFLSLEPHLAGNEPGGGPDAFRRAAIALRSLVAQVRGVQLA